MLDFLVQLDPVAQELIAFAVTALVSFLLIQVYNVLPWLGDYLGQHKVAVTVWLTGVVVQLVQTYLDKIPESLDAVVITVIQLIIEVAVVLFGFAYAVKAEVKGSEALL